MIVFGWYSWLISRYTAKELNLPEGDWDNVSFEVRQKCFHLFYIPFFSIGKMYVMRKDGNKYELTSEFEAYMRAAKPHNTPWYAYLGLILIPICLIGYRMNDAYKRYERTQYQKELIQQRLDWIDNPQIHDVYKLYNNHYDGCMMRVEQFTKDSIQIGMPSVLDNSNRYFLNAENSNKYFDQLGSQLWKAWIAKSDLKKAIDTDENKAHKFKSDFQGRSFPELLIADTLYISDILRFPQ